RSGNANKLTKWYIVIGFNSPQNVQSLSITLTKFFITPNLICNGGIRDSHSLIRFINHYHHP
ncbi:hypothetical protein L9F63_001678, partial [Diploptera punctata]